MASDYYTTDDEGLSAQNPLQTPADTPFQTPGLSASRRSSGRYTPTSVTPSTPPPLPNGFSLDKSQADDDAADVHRFTPSLHASLVSEILSLRRELESKTAFIERLESNLSSAKSENESLQETLAKQAKESRAVKVQLQSIEDGTLTAIEDLCKERDAANEANVELKKKLSSSQSKLKGQEDETRRVHDLWEKEKAQWTENKRTLERKIHVTEGRLKAVVEEVVAHEAEVAAAAAVQSQKRPTGDAPVVDGSEGAQYHGAETLERQAGDEGSLDLGDDGEQSNEPAGASLAEELNLDAASGDEGEDEVMGEGGDEDWVEEEAGVQGKASLAHAAVPGELAKYALDSPQRVRDSRPISITQTDERSQSRDSTSASPAGTDHRASMDSAQNGGHPGSPTWSRTSVDLSTDHVSGSAEGKVKQMVKRISLNQARANSALQKMYPRMYRESVPGTKNYVSTGVQFSPPPSPPLKANAGAGDPQDLSLYERSVNVNAAGGAIGSGLSDRADRPTDADTVMPGLETSPAVALPTPAETPTNEKTMFLESATHAKPPDSQSARSPMRSIATQTQPISIREQSESSSVENIADEQRQSTPEVDLLPLEPKRAPPPRPPTRAPPLPPISVPSIAIHPPESGNVSPTDAVLPPGTRSVGCQTEIVQPPAVQTRSAGIQTEGIRIDKRPIKLPQHLLPSSIVDSASSNSSGPVKDSGVEARSRDSSPLPSPASSRIAIVPGEEKEESRWSRLKKALLWGPDSEYQEDYDDGDVSDGDYAPQAPPRVGHRAQKLGRSFDPPTPVPENEKAVISRPYGHPRSKNSEGSRASLERPGRPTKAYGGRSFNFRTLASTPSQHSRTPSYGSNASSSNHGRGYGPAPPFAIPIRSSSAGIRTYRRKIQVSPTRRMGARASPRASQELQRNPSQRPLPPMLRKTRSAAVLEDERRAADTMRYQQSSAVSQTSFPESSARASTAAVRHESHTHTNQLTQSSLVSLPEQYQATSPTGNASVDMSARHTVVDAITATMIGEWMFKYVRKRSSFGKPEQSQDFSKDARHKRWVWISPYERTIMWSSKQPISNAALMGKTGRTLAIQSVLDVKDDTPLPKSSKDNVFNRSILVLTPSRALKFTAVSRERHYLWLSALSFLAHHTTSGFADMNFLPAPPSGSAHESNSTTTRSHASSIRRGTLRAGKDKSVRSQHSSGPATPTLHTSIDTPQYGSRLESQVPDAAFAPTIPRVPLHSRKRSTTNPNRSKNPVPLRSRTPNRAGSSNNSTLSAGGGSGRSSSAAHRSHVLSAGSSDRPVGSQPGFVDEIESPTGFMSSAGVVHGLDGVQESPRQSSTSADFGGNTNFFDAVGMVRMDAFMSPGVGGSTAPSPTDARPAAPAGIRAASNSQESFIGPPNISRARMAQSHSLKKKALHSNGSPNLNEGDTLRFSAF